MDPPDELFRGDDRVYSDYVLYARSYIETVYDSSGVSVNAQLCALSRESCAQGLPEIIIRQIPCICGSKNISRAYHAGDRMYKGVCDGCIVKMNIIESKTKLKKWWTIDGILFINDDELYAYRIKFPFVNKIPIPISISIYSAAESYVPSICDICGWGHHKKYECGGVMYCYNCVYAISTWWQTLVKKLPVLRTFDIPDDIKTVIIWALIDIIQAPMINGKIFHGNETINIEI